MTRALREGPELWGSASPALSEAPARRRAARGTGWAWLRHSGGGSWLRHGKGRKGGFGRKGEVLRSRGRAWDPKAILFISFHNSAVLLQDKSLSLCQIWPAGIWGRRWATRRRCFPTTPVPPHQPFQHSKDLVFYIVTVSCCDTIPGTVSGAPLFEPEVAPASHVAAQLYSDMMGSSTEDLGSLGKLSTILVWGISYQLLLVIESWKFVCSVNPVPRRLILFAHRLSQNAVYCSAW